MIDASLQLCKDFKRTQYNYHSTVLVPLELAIFNSRVWIIVYFWQDSFVFCEFYSMKTSTWLLRLNLQAVSFNLYGFISHHQPSWEWSSTGHTVWRLFSIFFCPIGRPEVLWIMPRWSTISVITSIYAFWRSASVVVVHVTNVFHSSATSIACCSFWRSYH